MSTRFSNHALQIMKRDTNDGPVVPESVLTPEDNESDVGDGGKCLLSPLTQSTLPHFMTTGAQTHDYPTPPSNHETGNWGHRPTTTSHPLPTTKQVTGGTDSLVFQQKFIIQKKPAFRLSRLLQKFYIEKEMIEWQT